MTRRDYAVIDNLLVQAQKHDSGCNYHFVAGFVKGSRQIRGVNRLADTAVAKCSYYKPVNGRHAEHHLTIRAHSMGIRLRGGTIYITGVRNTRRLNTTAPCNACRKLLVESTSVRALVYWQDGTLVKEML